MMGGLDMVHREGKRWENERSCRKANAFPDTIDPLSISLTFRVGRTPGAVLHVKRDAIK